MPVSVTTFATAGEAATALAAGRGAAYMGGGTLLMRRLNEGDVGLSALVLAKDPALAQIRAAGSRIAIGAGVTLAQILAERDLAFLHPVARSIGGPAVRNMGTVGGNLFVPAPFGDFSVALLALDAMATVPGGHATREMPMEEFLAGRERAGLVLSVAFERPQNFRYVKVSRVKPKGASVLSIALNLPGGGGRHRIAYGAMGPFAIRAKAAERALEGRALDASGIAPAIALAAEGTNPATDAIASAWYRREVVGVHLRRLLLGER